jgi:Carboxypeptidase regulatory-like domain
MKPNWSRVIFAVGLLLFVLVAESLQAQESGATLSGSITNNLGATVANAKITVRNLATGTSTEAETGAMGAYSITGLAPGEYEVSASAEGFTPKVSKVTLAAGSSQTLNMSLIPTLSVQGLGFPTSETQGSAQEQARLDKRSRMLKTHQRLGLITAVPLVATVILGTQAGGKATSSSTRDLHAALGGVTAGMYFTTAYYSIFAPKVPGTKTRGAIRVHKALAWIHGPGMILTPILGAIAFSQKSNGEKVHGIASAHGAVAIVTAGAYGAAILAVSVKF